MVAATDLKSVGRNSVPVRVRPPAPTISSSTILPLFGDGFVQMQQLKKFALTLLDGRKREFHYRETTADNGVIRQILKNGDYSFKRLRRGSELIEKYSRIVTQGKKPLILDAGANIGASVVWFQNEFPDSHVLAFEPDTDNFELLVKNTQFLNVDLRLAALGSMDGRASIVNPEADAWGFRTEIDDAGKVQLISISRTIGEEKAKNCEPFIVKIDIEGGEDNLFANSTSWVEDFPVLIIELHDWLFPRKGTSRNFLKAISKLDRDFVHLGENIFSIKNDL